MTRGLTTQWIALVIAASLIGALDGGWLASWTSLDSSEVWRGQVWRLVTWPFVEQGPLLLVIHCIAIYKFGGELVVAWGERRVRRYMLQIVVGAALATCVLAAITGAHVDRIGGWAATDALLVAWARQFPQHSLILYGMIELRGRQIVRILVGTAIAFAIYYGPVVMAPELVASLAAAMYPRGWLR